ncbi:hypothetical protein JG687_00019352, partial [Phytophthora cactorum]
VIAVIRGGNHCALRSQANYIRAGPATSAHFLPNEILIEGIIRVTMAGALTEPKKTTDNEKYEARPARLRKQLT